MKILIVCSGNALNFEFSRHQAFVYDQAEALKRAFQGISIDIFPIKGKGIKGYLSNRERLKNQLRSQPYDCIHAHVVQSGLLANLQRDVPVITTFHGSDINVFRNRMISLCAEILSQKTIYVSDKLRNKVVYASNKDSSVIPCGVDFDLFKPIDQQEARKHLNLEPQKKYILFSSGFDVAVKNYPLAQRSVRQLNLDDVILLELKGYSRKEVSLLFSAVNVALMTSFSEGSPQFIKEAMACNCPIVSTDVGDVQEVIGDTMGCFITDYDAPEIAERLKESLSAPIRTNGRKKITSFDNQRIAELVMQVYKKAVS